MSLKRKLGSRALRQMSLAGALLAAHTAAHGADAGLVRATLEEAVASDSTSDLVLSTSAGSDEIKVGESLAFEVTSAYAGYCYLLHIDARDRATLMAPSGCDAGDREVGGNVVGTFPSRGSLTADYPLGGDSVYAVMSPMKLEALDGLLAGRPAAMLAVADAEALASDLAQSAQSQEISLAMVSYNVVENPSDTQYTTRGIIRRVVAGMEAPNADGEAASFDVENIQFDFGSDTLSSESKRQLQVFGEALSSNELSNARLKVAGHTDDVGDADYNDTLSVKRANAVRAYLVDEFGLAPDRLESIGYGESAPILNNDTEEARAMNRRVEMVFLEDK